MPALTLDRLLASIGFGSRKESRALVRMGMVELDGKVLDDPFMEFKERPEFITVNGEEVPTIEKLYIMMDKPLDVECSHNARDHQSVFELLPDRFTAMGIQTVGRLDADSSGLLLFSNQGDFPCRVSLSLFGLGRLHSPFPHYNGIISAQVSCMSMRRSLALQGQSFRRTACTCSLCPLRSLSVL